MTQTQYFLCALHTSLYEAWQGVFADVDAVDVIQGDILKARADAIVSPANSFGFMDGGLDLIYSQHFGWELEGRVRSTILEEHDGELPVGQALIVPTEHEATPYLISAPTMRVPSRVARTAHAYLAFRAVLRAVRDHNQAGVLEPIRTVLCPGLGTGEGRMPPERCAVQMRYAWAVIHERELLRKGGLAAAVRNHLMLLGEEA